MVRQLVGVAVLSLVLAACSSTPIGQDSAQGSSETVSSSINLPLTTQVRDITYRLRLASFLISGEPLAGKSRVVKPLDNATVHNEPLPVGSYSILLQPGWVLEKLSPGSKIYTPVKAELVTPNPMIIDVNGTLVADALFGFATTSGDVMLGDGSVNIRIGVQDCEAFDSYTASLGALTADCLGTVDPRAYGLNADGFLVPKFDSCPVDQAKFRPIKQLLSLQYRSARLPFVKECIAGRHAAYLQKFESSGVTACPAWKLEREVNPMSEAVMERVIAGLPKLPVEDNGKPPGVLELLKFNNIYSVFFEQTPPGQKCQTPAECAAVCAAAYPGFVLPENLGESAVLTDPPAWMLDTTYPLATNDPYLRPGYYHPMSWYGGAPGVQFGEYARFVPCVGNGCKAESCSYYAGIHKQTQLQLDCVDDTDLETCNSYCGPALPVP